MKQRKILIAVICILVVLWLLLCAGAAMLYFRGRHTHVPETTEASTSEPTTVVTTTVETTAAETEPEPTESPIPLNRFDERDFEVVGEYLTCVSDWCLNGIDVSKYQSSIDWQQVKEAGISFVMIRVGGRGYGKAGNMFPDEMANKHYRGAKEAGLLVGAYFFSQAVSVEEAVQEAQYALELTKDWDLDLPIAYDWEYLGDYARTANVEDRVLTDCAIAFCDEIEAADRLSMIYVSPWFGKYILEDLADYDKWLALYKGDMTYRYEFDMWQYTCIGGVPGVKGDVDINILVRSY